MKRFLFFFYAIYPHLSSTECQKAKEGIEKCSEAHENINKVQFTQVIQAQNKNI